MTRIMKKKRLMFATPHQKNISNNIVREEGVIEIQHISEYCTECNCRLFRCGYTRAVFLTDGLDMVQGRTTET